MGYLTLDGASLPDMNKATISVWFRIPTAAIEARRAETPGFYWDFDVMVGIIPILAFGDQQQGTVFIWETKKVGEDVYADISGPPLVFPVYGLVLGDAHEAPMSPSWIGVYVGGPAFPQDPPILSMRLQSSDIATGTGLSASTSGYIPPPTDSEPTPPPAGEFISEDTSSATLAAPVWLGQESTTEVEPDHWHHLLISWDLQAGNSGHGIGLGGSMADGTTSSSKMWVAFDDKNKIENDLPAQWVDGAGPNDILCAQVGNVAGGSVLTQSVSVSFSPGTIATRPIDIPAKSTYDQQPSGAGEGTIPATTEPVERIEMAELQIFCGVALDTASASNRRAFVDADGKPAKPELAKELLGRKPDILLHGTNNWRAGKNTGSLGVSEATDGSEELNSAGQFRKAGTIDPYKPDPSLHGAQAPDAPAALRRKAGSVQLTRTRVNARL